MLDGPYLTCVGNRMVVALRGSGSGCTAARVHKWPIKMKHGQAVGPRAQALAMNARVMAGR